ncbi:MAG: SRPBCC family protein, partial [Dehalococcoidia bacterium]
MARVEKDIEVNLPVRTVYNQWTQFEEFPQFMEGVEEVRQLDEKRLHWRASIGGREQEWEAEIREQVPDERVIWQNITGAMNAGQVSFL